MPLTAKGQEIMAAMKKEYGEKKGEEVFYAAKNAGKISGVDSVRDDASESEKSQAFKEGKAAHTQNKPLSACPYKDEELARMWRLGWKGNEENKRGDGTVDLPADVNPINLGIDSAPVMAKLDEMSHQINSLGSRARNILERVDAEKRMQDYPEYQKYQRLWEEQNRFTDKYNAAAQAYSAGKMDYKEWRALLEESQRRTKAFDLASKEFRAWKRSKGFN